jgi:2-keto-4-pentenoate hydratase/2-oxohepta-3-ene-1,7-dioic acid hydratase in catechol pathway
MAFLPTSIFIGTFPVLLFLPPAERHLSPFRNDFGSALRPNVLPAYTPEQYGDAMRADRRRIVRGPNDRGGSQSAADGARMKLLSFVGGGEARFGALSGDGVITMNDRIGHATLRDALAAGALEDMRKLAQAAKPDRRLAEITFLPAIPHPEKILCAGINYRAHAAETGRDVPQRPSLFARFADTLVGHEGALIRPRVSRAFDFEGELAVVIGRGGRHIKAAQALDYVAGYTCFVDGSVRDYQKFSVTAGKNFPGTGPLGPWIATTDEIPDPGRLTLTTRLNDVEMQRATTGDLIHSIGDLIAFCSDFTALSPGDIIATGTPSGVGHSRTPPLWMKAGDVLEVEITGIGTLRAHVVDEPFA